jgi:outer membrane protein assembly factor BamE (lipoprotein component of BamABCDE complex)
MRIIAIVALCAVLMGCAGGEPASIVQVAGPRFEWANARAVHVGTKQAELQSLMGDPYQVTTAGDKQIWLYYHANGLTGSNRHISFALKDGAVSAVPTIPDLAAFQ